MDQFVSKKFGLAGGLCVLLLQAGHATEATVLGVVYVIAQAFVDRTSLIEK